SKLKAKIDSDLGGGAKIKEDFTQAGVTQFGPGWAPLAGKDRKIFVSNRANGENPIGRGGPHIAGPHVSAYPYDIDCRDWGPAYRRAFLGHLLNGERVEEVSPAASKNTSLPFRPHPFASRASGRPSQPPIILPFLRSLLSRQSR